MADSGDKLYRLSTIIEAHNNDVRCLAEYPLRKGFVTGSRDHTGKLYIPSDDGKSYKLAQHFIGPSNYVSSVCVVTSDEKKEAKIYLGCNDAVIYVFTENESTPIDQLLGHSGSVSCLSGQNSTGRFVSGSWDQSAIVWNSQHEKIVTLKGHNNLVWAVAFLGEDKVLTGSADRTIKAWTLTGELVQTFVGHTDVVRALSVINDVFFMSCSNDGTLKRWSLEDNGAARKTYECHKTYTYDMDYLANATDSGVIKVGFITCSEDRTVKLWKKGHLHQIIPIPASSVWSVVTMNDGTGDLAVAAANGCVYVFTTDETKYASESVNEKYCEAFGKIRISPTEVGSKQVLPSAQDLLRVTDPQEGQTEYILNEDRTEVLMFLRALSTWLAIGYISGDATQSKKEFEGKMYDHIIDVDVEGTPLKLPFNAGDNPKDAAAEFVRKHSLPYSYMDTIEDFILKNIIQKS